MPCRPCCGTYVAAEARLVLTTVLTQINFADRHTGDNGNKAKITVDGTDCSIEEQSPFDPDLWSHKINAAGLRYEIGIALQSGLVCWVNGPYKPGPWPDLRIFRHRLMSALANGEFIVADRGYKDGEEFVFSKDTGPDWLKEMIGRATARHETLNGKLKVFNVLSTRFRHGIERHESVFNALINIIQLVLIHESPLFDVHYDDRDYTP